MNEAVAAIESLHAGSEQRAQLILVRLGLKPAAELSLFPWNSSPEEAEVLLTKAALKYARREEKRHPKAIAEYAVARDEETVQKLLGSGSSTEFGALMGYPETAVRAFETKDFYAGALPEDVERSIFKMKFSRKHFEEEFDVIRRWNRALAERAPELLAEYSRNSM